MVFEQVRGVSQLFIKRNTDGTIAMILAKITDELLFAGDTGTMKEFTNKLTQRFKVSKYLINEPINFNGARIEQDEIGNISINMGKYMKLIKLIDIPRMRLKQENEKRTRKNIRHIDHLQEALRGL